MEPDLTPPDAEKTRVVKFVASPGLAPLLAQLGSSLLVSTYHAGKLVTIGTYQNELVIEFHNFELAMGLALHPRMLAVGARHDIWFLHAQPELPATIEPRGKYDACLLTRKAMHTGTIHGHEMAFCGEELWVANTLFSCLCTLDERFHFVPRWKPKFISELKGPEDRCHLNGITRSADGSRIQYVTCLGESNEPQGWRANKVSGGVIIDVASDEVVSRGFAMPHSPRLYNGQLYVLDSGRGTLQTVEPASGARTDVETFPGYARGMGFVGQIAFVGLSKIRETAVFGGVPIAENRENLRCGIAAVDLQSGRTVATLEFVEGVEEIFEVQGAPGVRCPAIRGPHLPIDGHPPIWVVPPLGANIR